MEHRIVRIAFNRHSMFVSGGISLNMMREILTFLPTDASIVGFGCDSCSLVDYIYVSSSIFSNVGEAGIIPDCRVLCERKPHDGVVHVIGMILLKWPKTMNAIITGNSI